MLVFCREIKLIETLTNAIVPIAGENLGVFFFFLSGVTNKIGLFGSVPGNFIFATSLAALAATLVTDLFAPLFALVMTEVINLI